MELALRSDASSDVALSPPGEEHFSLPCAHTSYTHVDASEVEEREMFSLLDAAISFFPFGFLISAHRFYLHRYFTGILQLVTFGFCGVWWMIDGFSLVNLVDLSNDREL